MAKPFKTISLEERYKESALNQRLPLPTTVKAKEGMSLKLAPDAIKKNSAILKAIIKTPSREATSLREFNTAPLSSIARPFTNTKFRSAISLGDRLSQRFLGTTTYLPQYFLSDKFADYIKITPFGLFNHTSDIQITYPSTKVNQGGTETKPYETRVSQGSVSLRVLNYDSLILQGAVFSNGTYVSRIVVGSPTANPNQGPGTNPTLAKGADTLQLLQGLIISNSQLQSVINPKLAKKVESLALLQGLIISNNQLQSVINPALSAPNGAYPVIPLVEITLTKPAGAYTKNPKIRIVPTRKELSVFVPKDIIITPTRVEVTQAIPENASNILPFTFVPKINTPTLKLLRYELSRTLAYFSPIVAHGSSGLSDNITKAGSTYFQNSVDTVMQARSPGALIGNIDAAIDYNTGKVDIIGYLNSLKVVETISKASIDYKKVGTYTSGAFNVSNEDLQLNPSGSLKTEDVAVQSGENAIKVSLGDYTTLTYSQIANRQTNATTDGLLKKDFRELLNLPSTKYIGGEKPSKWIEKKGTVEDVSPLSSARNPGKDFITLQIAYTPTGGKRVPLSFRAYLTSFSDSFTSEFGSKTFFNRGTDIRSFQKAGRDISVGFKVPCLTSTDANLIYGRLQQLCQLACIPGQVDGIGVNPPAFDLTIGRWAVKLPVIITNVKLDLQTSDYTWDIGTQLPHIVDVSLSCTVDVAKGAEGFAIINKG